MLHIPHHPQPSLVAEICPEGLLICVYYPFHPLTTVGPWTAPEHFRKHFPTDPPPIYGRTTFARSVHWRQPLTQAGGGKESLVDLSPASCNRPCLPENKFFLRILLMRLHV
ncbi:hypothetical protein CEXT_369911 [Caerostris extrusa]|uniref:Uncharacterized protein n=1 Tax=Caerostris extrusa TaxID=172846 RepID=A0AAV4UNZ1_CAEEX|nr:hypothetical protein CEXT_369911 [Caerostris extrusa]